MLPFIDKTYPQVDTTGKISYSTKTIDSFVMGSDRWFISTRIAATAFNAKQRAVINKQVKRMARSKCPM